MYPTNPCYQAIIVTKKTHLLDRPRCETRVDDSLVTESTRPAFVTSMGTSSPPIPTLLLPRAFEEKLSRPETEAGEANGLILFYGPHGDLPFGPRLASLRPERERESNYG